MVSVIIINYNTFSITCACIASVIKHTIGVAYQIILVDNASPNDNADDFLIQFPSITLIKSPINGGFAKGNNLGIQHATGSHILLLNSDTVLQEDSITKAYKQYKALDGVGALSVRLIYPDGKLQHTARKFRSISHELLDVARPVLLLLPYKKRANLMMNQYFKGDYNTFTDWVSGAFMLFDKRILDKLPNNILDERFFMYGEDQLWCYQFHQLGYRNFYYADTEVIHLHAASTSKEKQLQLLKRFLELEIKIMEYRFGKGLYLSVFSLILKAKENFRYTVKRIALKVFGIQIR
ncbi:MAG: glycosyltransferase family 2 protein [Chitinophagia bacterium]|nr:glycosyltransferase family 2 protein [Chitinophagia bacterium]